MVASLAIVTCLYIGIFAHAAFAADEAFDAIIHAVTPRPMRGVWGQNGDCRHAKSLLIIRKTSASVLGNSFYKTIFVEHDSDTGNALLWAREYQSDNFQYDAVNDIIDWNSEGYHMPPSTVFHFTRCRRVK